MLIDQKEQLQVEYHKWLENLRKKKNLVVKDNFMSVINFLDAEKVLKDERR